MNKYIAILAFTVLSLPMLSQAAAIDDAITPQNCLRSNPACAQFLDTTSVGQIKWGGLVAGGLRSLTNLFVDGKMGIGTLRPSTGEQALRVDVEGAVGAKYYCDENGNHCVSGSNLGNGSGSSTATTILNSSSIFVTSNVNNTYTLSVSTSTIQSRVTGICAVGSAISKINADGTVDCQTVSGTVSGSGFWASSTANIFNINTGNVGIGTNNPLAKLDIAGNLRLVDGTQGDGKILVSDPNGFASWKSLNQVLPSCSEGQALRMVSGSWSCANWPQACVPEGGSLGAVVPSNTLECCPGLVQQFPSNGIVGSRGTCVKPISPVNGFCGAADSVASPVAPTSNLCLVGIASAVTINGGWVWTCAGLNGGVTASCSAPKVNPQPINGACGTSNGKTLSSAPVTNLCVAGTASVVTGSGPWSWTCAGLNSGSTASCSANKSTTRTVSGVKVCDCPLAPGYKVCNDNETVVGWTVTATSNKGSRAVYNGGNTGNQTHMRGGAYTVKGPYIWTMEGDECINTNPAGCSQWTIGTATCKSN